jgi:hypothetical protein
MNEVLVDKISGNKGRRYFIFRGLAQVWAVQLSMHI